MKTRVLVAAALVAIVPRLVVAADAPAAPSPSLADMLTAAGLDVHGYVDAAYSWLSGTGTFTSGTPDRVFDTEANSFNLHQAALTVDYLPKDGFGGLVNLTAGRDARVIYSYGESTSNFDLTQAYAQYAHGPLTLIGGKFVTLAGAEVINSTADTNYSRSILFGYAIPFSHTGVRVVYAATSEISITVGLNNGWDQLQSAQKQKTAEAAVTFTPNTALSFIVDGYSGVTNIAPSGVSSGFPLGTQGRRDLIDGVATWNATSKLTLILNADWADQVHGAVRTDGSLGTATWDGVAGYANYQLDPQWAVSVRGEVFDDKDGYRTGIAGGQTWSEGTVTLRYLPNAHVELRAEGRYDHSNGDNFVNDGVAFTTSNGTLGVKNDQASIGLEGIFKF